MTRELSVIVPTYNEAANVTELIERVTASLKDVDFEIVFVDDGSPDGTAEAIEEYGKIHGNISVLRRASKMGLASAVMDGLRLTEADVVAVMDADLQHPPEILPKMYVKLNKGHGLVVASRYIEGGGIEGWSMRRRLISKGATFLAHLLLPATRKVKDPMSGYFMLRREVVEETHLNPMGLKILLIILGKCQCDSVSEVPYTFLPRKKGESKLALNDIYKYILNLYRIFLYRRLI